MLKSAGQSRPHSRSICPALNETPGTLSNEEGKANDDGSEKSHFWLALFSFVWVIRILFSQPWILWAENDGKKTKEILRVPRTLKKVSLRSNFSDIFVQVVSSMDFNVQL